MLFWRLHHDVASSTSFTRFSFSLFKHVNWSTPFPFIVSLLAFFVSNFQPLRAFCDYKKSSKSSISLSACQLITQIFDPLSAVYSFPSRVFLQAVIQHIHMLKWSLISHTTHQQRHSQFGLNDASTNFYSPFGAHGLVHIRSSVPKACTCTCTCTPGAKRIHRQNGLLPFHGMQPLRHPYWTDITHSRLAGGNSIWPDQRCRL